MIIYKAYYKLNIISYVEFVALSGLLFDDIHYNMNAGDAKLGTSIKRYIKGEDLFAGKFNYYESKRKILRTLSNINLKGFKKYAEKTEKEKFKSLISGNMNF